jgi:PAS domain S-box-containing protein
LRDILQGLKKGKSPVLCGGLRVRVTRSVAKDVLVQAGPAPWAIPRSSAILFAMTDLTCFSERNRRLIDAEANWESLIASDPDYFVLVDRKGIVQFINRSVDGTVGQVLGRPMVDFVVPKDRAIARRALRQAFTFGRPVSYEVEGITPGGKVGSYAMRVAPVKRDKRITAALLIARDISAQKKIEEKLRLHQTHLAELVKKRTGAALEANTRLRREIEQRKSVAARLLRSQERLRALSRHLQRIAEKERTSLAHDIHDEMGAALMRLKFTVDSLTEGGGGVAHFRQVKRELSSQIQQTMDEIRNLIARLRPPILDEIGVAAAIVWEARIFEQKSKIRCQVGDVSENLGLDDEKATALFRVFQELLTNIGRHSEATAVEVRLVRHKGLVSLRVSDNGCGIRPAVISRSLGLVGIRERLDGLGGRFRISRRKEGGTCAEAFLPVDDKP